MSKSMDDLSRAIHHLIVAFHSHNIEPAVIELATWESGMALRHGVDPGRVEIVIDEETKMPKNEMLFDGIRIRWPAKKVLVKSEHGSYEQII